MTSNFMVLLLFVVSINVSHQDRCGNCAYMIWGCNCDTVTYCLKKQCTVKPQCLTQCGATEGGKVESTTKEPMTEASATTNGPGAGGVQPMTVSVTTGGTKSPVTSATTKRPGADRCGNCAYMIWGCNCATVNYCLKKQCTVKPQCLTQCGVTEGGEVESTTKQPMTVLVTTGGTKSPVISAQTKRPGADRCGNCAYMIWGCNCATVTYCVKKQCTVKPQCLTECGVTEGGEVEITTKQPMSVSVTTGGTKSPVTSATTKRPGAHRCGNCAYMIWGCNCATVNYCLKKQCTVKPQCLTQCGVTEGGEVESTRKQPMTVVVTTGGTKSPVISAKTKRPGANRCGNCAYMIWGCDCATVTYCLKKQCTVKPQCLTECGVTEGGEVETTRKQPMTVSATTSGTKSPVASATTKRPRADPCGNCAYMIWGCNCATVNFCLKKQCTVKPQCLTQCGVTEGGKVKTTTKQLPVTKKIVPLTEKLVPVTAKAGGRSNVVECQYCELMYWGCICDDVNYCLNKWNCPVKPLCLKKCGVTEEGEAETTTKQPPVTEEIVPVTAQAVGPILSRVECQYCELMYWGCNCDDVNYCLNRWNCPVKPLCLKKCGVTDGGKVKTTTKQPPLTEKIIPVTVERKHRIECQYCELMYWGCFCNGVNHCLNKWNCPVKPLCLKKCGLK